MLYNFFTVEIPQLYLYVTMIYNENKNILRIGNLITQVQQVNMTITQTTIKNCFQSLLVISFLLMISVSVSSAEIVSVKKDQVNVRTGPSTGSPVYMELFKGYPLKVVGKKGDWVKISDYEKDTGWIHSSLIGKGNTVIVNAKTKVNLRSGPSTKDAVVANIERGVVLTKISTKGKWVKIRHSSGTEGWIYNTLIWPN